MVIHRRTERHVPMSFLSYCPCLVWNRTQMNLNKGHCALRPLPIS